MDLPTFRELLSPAGQAALATATALAPTEATFLSVLAKLRKQHSGELAKAAGETALLRSKAAAKFQDAARMYFTGMRQRGTGPRDSSPMGRWPTSAAESAATPWHWPGPA
jgi:hypothetical protein